MISIKEPKLRFREFINNWQSTTLGDHSKSISSGKSSTTSMEDGEYGIYGSTGKIGATNNPDYLGDKILVARVGANAGAVYRVSGKYAVSDNTLIVELEKSLNISFAFSLIQRSNLNKLVFGSGQPLVTGGHLKKLAIVIPNPEEQQKVARFLNSVDDKISSLQAKNQLLNKYKKTVTQLIFSQKIRFKHENDDEYPAWEEKRFRDIFDRVTTKNIENNLNVLTISAQQGLVNQEKFFTKSVSAKNLTGYYLLNKDDFAYNKSYSKGYPMGAIKRLKNYDKGVVSTLYICFRTKPSESVSFFEQYFGAGFQNKEIEKIAQEGARNHGLLNISVTDFFENIIFRVPSLGEQQKIADFLTYVDNKIKLTKKELEQAKKFKQALLQQMFV